MKASLGKLRKTVWQKHWGLNIHSLTPQIQFFLPPSQTNFFKGSSTYTASFSSVPIHSNLSSRLSTTLLVRQLTSMLASQRNILLSLYYLASQQYLEVSHSFLGQSLFLVSVTSHIFLFIYLF